MPWIKEEKLYPIIVLLLILIMAVRTPLETDMWWHLRAGEETLLSKEVYSVDTFSFTREGADWINHSWLSQVLMVLIFREGSYYGLSIWVGICAVLSMLFVYLQMKGHPLLRSAVLLFAAVVSSVVWSPRPQIHTLVLFSLLGYLIFKYKTTKDIKYLIGTLPIFVLWGNLHGGYVLGVILMGSVIIGEILNKVLLNDFADNFSWRQISIFAVFMVSGFLVVLINPFGLDMWRIPFNTVGVETLQNVINEWASPDFHQAFQQPMLWMLLGVFSLIGLSKNNIDGSELVPLVAFSWAAMVARRNFGPFAIVAAPIFSKYLASLIDDWLSVASQKYMWVEKFLERSSQSNVELRPGLKNLINLVLISLLLVGAGWKVINVNEKEFIHQVEREFFPVDAVEYLESSEITGNMFNEYNWGGYLIWN
ncbi:MAG TPA: hypothetical protein ENF22_00365, partial [Chloroflexi bacterium]|nr:hypothetical protein [Chloroflexota bacterium]